MGEKKVVVPLADMPLTGQAILALSLYMNSILSVKRESSDSEMPDIYKQFSTELIAATLEVLRLAHADFYDLVCAIDTIDENDPEEFDDMTPERLSIAFTPSQISLVAHVLSSSDYASHADEVLERFKGDNS